MDSAAAKAAYDAAQRAAALASGASPVEQGFINAITKRYAWPQPEDQRSLDVAYADAMRELWQRFPDDADVGALFADALLNLRPWDLWTPDGTPRPETPEIMTTLEKVMQMVPDHPGANHFYIHTMEASPTPQKADRAADVLRDRIPGAGHLVHMPSHIDIRTGRYNKAVLANQRGVSVDSTWASEGGFYSLYRAHNYHFLAYAAMFDGQREVAVKAADDMVKQVPLDVVRAYIDFLDGFIAVPYHVKVRFGLWEEILKEPRPPADLLATTAFWRNARTIAFAALGNVKAASLELDSLRLAYEATPESRTIGNNPARRILEVGIPMAEGELEYRRGNYAKAYALLRTAVQRDDSLRYDEPWGWMMPVRHSLGALLLEQGRIKEAEQVYRDDLRLHPENGWALKGLAECLQRSGRDEDAEEVESRFRTVWARSDVAIKASCYCRTGSEM
jgi:tetratricopeptide (TPR) repeat protein